MLAENPLPAKTFAFLSIRAMPAGLDVQRAAQDYRDLLAAAARELPELGLPQQFWQPVRGQLDRILI